MRAMIQRSLTLLLPLAAACAPGGRDAADEVATVSEGIVNGDQVTDSRTNPGAVAVYHQHIINGSLAGNTRPCSGVAISRTYVLTALHCVTSGEQIDRGFLLSNSSLR